MFGLYRLSLAILVALSHHGLIVAGFNPGQWAVVCFYMLSGFLMERQFHKLVPQGGTITFYLDRFFRIFPLYLTVLLFAVIVSPSSWITILLNALLIPTNYSRLIGLPMLITPAWSLACEVQFYLLVPLFSILPTSAIRLLMGTSLLVFSASIALPQPDLWAYVFLPGILFAFLTGVLLNRQDWLMLRWVYGAMIVFCVAFAGSKFFISDVKSGIHINICLGYLFGTPCLFLLSRLSPKVVWDQTLGLFSFPLFLVHPVILVLFSGHPFIQNSWIYLGISLATAGCLILCVEKPFDNIRYAMRRKKTIPSRQNPIPLQRKPSP